MTPVIGRLKRRPEFLKVAGARRKWVTPGVILQARRRQRNDGASGPDRVPAEAIRVGLTASRKVGPAVARNRARRRLRAACSEVMPVMGQAGYDYVLIARTETLRRPYRQLLDDLRTALGRVAGERTGGGTAGGGTPGGARRRTRPAGRRP